MDQHQRHELRRKAPRDASYARLRGCNFLYHVQPVRRRGFLGCEALLKKVVRAQRAYRAALRAGLYHHTMHAARLYGDSGHGLQGIGRNKTWGDDQGWQIYRRRSRMSRRLQ